MADGLGPLPGGWEAFGPREALAPVPHRVGAVDQRAVSGAHLRQILGWLLNGISGKRVQTSEGDFRDIKIDGEKNG